MYNSFVSARIFPRRAERVLVRKPKTGTNSTLSPVSHTLLPPSLPPSPSLTLLPAQCASILHTVLSLSPNSPPNQSHNSPDLPLYPRRQHLYPMLLRSLALILSASASVLAQQIVYNSAHNVTSIQGTWSSGSRNVTTGTVGVFCFTRFFLCVALFISRE